MMHIPARADPPLTLAERLDRLNDTLQSLAQQLKDSIASAIGSAVAAAVRDGLRGLLGSEEEPEHLPERYYPDEAEEPGWSHPDRPLWHQEEEYQPRGWREPAQHRYQTSSRWSDALGVALQAGLCWLRRQPRRRPVVTAVVVALAAGVTALLVGPSVAAGAGVLASTASLLLTADALGPAGARLAG